MKPLISYYGGKQRIASRIVEQIWQIPHTVYAEPFAGGLSVLFAKGKPIVSNGDHYREAINDHSEGLINLYRVAREQPAEFQRWVELTPYSQAEYQRAVEWLKDSDRTPLERAWAYYVNIQQSFANKLNAGWGTQVLNENKGATWAKSKNHLPMCLHRLSDVYASCEDALRFIERWDSPQTLFYCDPPYPGTSLGHYGGYTLEDWQNLCNLLDSIKGGYILSNYPQSVVPQSAQQVIEIDAVMSAAKCEGRQENNKRVEVLWICDRSSGIRDELQPVLDKLFPHRRAQQQFTIFDIQGAQHDRNYSPIRSHP